MRVSLLIHKVSDHMYMYKYMAGLFYSVLIFYGKIDKEFDPPACADILVLLGFLWYAACQAFSSQFFIIAGVGNKQTLPYEFNIPHDAYRGDTELSVQTLDSDTLARRSYSNGKPLNWLSRPFGCRLMWGNLHNPSLRLLKHLGRLARRPKI